MPPKKGEAEDNDNEDENENKEDLQFLLEEEPDRLSITTKKVKKIRILKYIRIFFLFLTWCVIIAVFLITHDGEKTEECFAVPIASEGINLFRDDKSGSHGEVVELIGPFMYKDSDIVGQEVLAQDTYLEVMQEESKHFLLVKILSIKTTADFIQGSSGNFIADWKLELAAAEGFDSVSAVRRRKKITAPRGYQGGVFFYHFVLENVKESVPLLVDTYPGLSNTASSIVLTVVIVFGWLMFLFWDVTSRAIIGLIFCTLAVALMGVYYIRPQLREIVQFVDIDYALLLIGLTFMTGILGETGGDRFLAVKVISFSKGHVWPMLTVFCFVSAATAAFLDQLTTLVLITLFAIRICELQQLNPSSVITCLIIFSNIGYILTPTGIVGKSVAVASKEEWNNYGMYIAHMLTPVTIAMIVSYTFLRLFYRSTKSMQNIEPTMVIRLKHAIRFWNRTAQAVGDYSEAEKAVQQSVRLKVKRLRDRLKRLGKMPVPTENFDDTIKRLEERHKLKHKSLFILVVAALGLVILTQIAYTLNFHDLSNGWICLLFSLVLLALTDCKDFESLMTKIDWSTLLLIACIMIITKAVHPLGLLDEISNKAINTIRGFEKESRIYYGVVIQVLLSAFASAFFDTSYVCARMGQKVLQLSEAMSIEARPLILAIILGAGFGSNFTLISAFSNIVCAGLSEKHECKFYFWDFFKVGAAITVLNLIFGIAYIHLYVLILDMNKE